MFSIKAKLSQIESRLQALIEGSAARLFPADQKQTELVARLVSAMQAGIRTGADGALVAPNLFYVQVNPAQAQALRENPLFVEGLTRTLQDAATEAGLHFPSPPVIRVSASPDVSTREVRVHAQNSLENLTQTSDMEVIQQEEREAIPPNAFVIVNGMKIFTLDQPVVNIGRRLDNQLVIDDPRVSRVHAQLRAIRGRYVIFDLDSTGGTAVNGETIHQCTLYPGDVISLSGVPVIYGQDSTGQGETQDFIPGSPQGKH